MNAPSAPRGVWFTVGGGRICIGLPIALQVRAVVCVAREIPAWWMALVGKQTVYASPRLGRVEEELGFAVFLWHGIVAVHDDGSVRVSAGDDAYAKKAVVGEKSKKH